MKTEELLNEILKEIKKNNNLLEQFLTNGEHYTPDALHGTIVSIEKYLDDISRRINKIE